MDFRFWRYEEEPEGQATAGLGAAQIIPGLWYVGGSHVCCYLILAAAGPVMVDTGLAEEADQYVRSIAEASTEVSELAWILHTHGHYDHIGASARLLELSSARTAIGEDDVWNLAGKVPVDRSLADGDAVAVGDVLIRFVHTPGHTPGCGMYLTEVEQTRVCFVGDACGPFIFETTRWDGDVEAFVRGAARMKEIEADLYLPGHPHQTWEVSAGDPRLTRQQWHRYIDGRVAAMEEILARRTRSAAHIQTLASTDCAAPRGRHHRLWSNQDRGHRIG